MNLSVSRKRNGVHEKLGGVGYSIYAPMNMNYEKHCKERNKM